jgi:hypothetical protein
VRLLEIASAEEQIELWKLVSNSVWQSLQLQQQTQQKRDAAATAARKSAPKAKRRVRGANPMPSLPKVPTPKPATPPPRIKATPMAYPNAKTEVPPTNISAPSTVPTSSTGMPDLQKSAKTGGLSRNMQRNKSLNRTDDRHSKNTN